MESGFDYFGARYYASSMGRFLSPGWSAKEEAVPYPDLTNPQSLNLYSYVGDNPLSHAHDPPRRLRQREAKFDIKTLKDQPAHAALAPGKVQIIFIQTNEGRDKWFTIAPTRFGVDGA